MQRGSRRAQEELGREFDLAPIEIVTFVAHPAQDPEHLDGIQVVDVHAAARLGRQHGTVAGDTQDIAHAQRGRAEDLALQAGACAVARGDLHDRFGAVLDGNSDCTPRRSCAGWRRRCR